MQNITVNRPLDAQDTATLATYQTYQARQQAMARLAAAIRRAAMRRDVATVARLGAQVRAMQAQ